MPLAASADSETAGRCSFAAFGTPGDSFLPAKHLDLMWGSAMIGNQTGKPWRTQAAS
jgi:hypothetical protein